MKKILSVLIVLVGLVFLFGCEGFGTNTNTNPYEGTTYSITYVVDGKIANLAPASYVAGEITVLGSVDNGYVGWYTNPSYTGATFNSIDKSEYGDKTYYAKPSSYNPPTPPTGDTLASAIAKMTSFKVKFDYIDEDPEYNDTCDFEYANGIIKYISEDETGTYADYYFYDAAKKMYCIYLDNSDGYDVYYEDDELFGFATLYIVDLDIASINEANYTKDGNVYTAKADKITTEAYNVFYQYEFDEITSFVVETNESGISKITLEFVSEDDGDKYTGKYVATFSSIGKVSVTLPEIGDNPDTPPTPPTQDTDLGKAVAKMTSFDYHAAYIDSDPSYNEEYDFSFCNGVIRYEYENGGLSYVDYYYYNEKTDTWIYLSDDGHGTYDEIPEDDDFFEYYVMYIIEFDLTGINENNYTANGNTYTCKSDKLLEEALNVFPAYDFSGITSLVIVLNSNGISRLTLTFEDEYEGEAYTGTYDITFTNVGKSNFELPEHVVDFSYAVGDVYNHNDGASITVQGYVCGTVGNNFYLTDGTDGVYIYFGSSTHNYKFGDYICLTGVKDTYKGLIELKNLSACVYVDSKTHEVPAKELVNFGGIDNYLSMNISIEDVELIELPDDFDSSSKSDLSFNIKSRDGGTILLFISKHISSSIKEVWYDLLSDCKEGDFINIENAVVSCFNDYQIAFTEQTVITKGYKEGDPIEVKAIELNKDEYIVELGTTLEDALKDLVVTLKYNNRTTAVATKDQYEILNMKYDKDVKGTYLVVVKCEGLLADIYITVKGEPQDAFKADNTKVQKLDDLADLYELTYGLPSTGEGKALIIPVDFTDYPAPQDMVANLNIAFFGNETQTGWESLQSYYLESSYGKLNISGLVTDVYHTGKSSTYYTNRYDPNSTADPLEYEIITAALKYFDNDIDYTEFDSNNDGYIDAIYLIYSCPVDYDSDYAFWWAYTYEYFTDDFEYYDGVEADYYFFAGYEFINEKLRNGSYITNNAETFIHETGHILGLTDYYDTNDNFGPRGGLGGGDMMDYNVGDHNAFSKAILGWVEPWIVTGKDCTITLDSFGATGDCIIIAKDWNDTYFDEYYIIDFYTPDGLNELEKGDNGLFSNAGVRIMHVDATYTEESIESYYSVWYVYVNNNSDTNHKLVDLVQADKSSSINKDNTYSYNSDLFYQGDSFDWAKWYDGTDCGFTLTVKSIVNGKAEIEIDFE